MHDFQNFPSQLFFFFFLSSHRAAFLQSFGLNIGLVPCLSAFTILLYPCRPDLRISALKVSLYPEFFKSCMNLLRCFRLVSQPSSLLQFNSLLMSSWVRVVLFCPHGCAELAMMTVDDVDGFEKNSNLTCCTTLPAGWSAPSTSPSCKLGVVFPGWSVRRWTLGLIFGPDAHPRCAGGAQDKLDDDDGGAAPGGWSPVGCSTTKS